MGGPLADGNKAHDFLLSFSPLAMKGYCWYYVWQAYKAAGAATSQGSTPTAYAAWNATSGKHPGDMNPPPGAAIWLGRRHSDGNMDGDVFIAGQYDGDHAATDYPTWGKVGLCTIQQRINQTGREYLGWSDHILDCPINLGDDDMGVNYPQDYDGIAESVQRGLTFDIRPNGFGTDANFGMTVWEYLQQIHTMTAATKDAVSKLTITGDVDEAELAKQLKAQGISVVIVQPDK